MVVSAWEFGPVQLVQAGGIASAGFGGLGRIDSDLKQGIEVVVFQKMQQQLFSRFGMFRG